MYTLPLGVTLRSHKIMYHIYADDTQRYCTFDADSSSDVLAWVEACVWDIRPWMIANKLKINDKKIEFFIISSPSFICVVGCKYYNWYFNNITLCIMLQSGCNVLWECLYGCPDYQLISEYKFPPAQHQSNMKSPVRLSCGTACNALVTSRIDYCNSLLYGIPDYKLNKLQ